MNVSAVSSQANYQAMQQATAASQGAALRQSLSAASGGTHDGDGDHGVETQSASSGKTGQLLNVLA